MGRRHLGLTWADGFKGIKMSFPGLEDFMDTMAMFSFARSLNFWGVGHHPDSVYWNQRCSRQEPDLQQCSLWKAAASRRDPGRVVVVGGSGAETY